MGHGGRRPGAGRKPGTANKRTREIADRAAATGMTPLQVMLENMEFAHRKADDILAKIVAGEVDPELEVDGRDPRIEALKQLLGFRKMAQDCAQGAAPYMHPRLNPVEVKPQQEEQSVPLVDRLKAYAREDAIEQSSGKVVDLGKVARGK